MIISQKDLDEFIEEYSDYQTDYRFLEQKEREKKIYDSEIPHFLIWLNENPQVVLSTGLHEYASHGKFSASSRLSNMNVLFPESQAMFRNVSGTWLLAKYIPGKYDEPWPAWTLAELQEMISLISTKGMGSDEEDYIWENPSGILPSAKEIIESLEKLISTPRSDPTLFVSPSLWTPDRQRAQVDALRDSAVSLIDAINSEEVDLQNLHWRQFEEIVAELLSKLGMDIHVNQEHPQGGRDIIARGSLIPGSEMVTIAVEVKHREYVDRPIVQKAIYQNRMFPALMFVTSGRFSAGVIQEARLPENRMRLFLKDGVAIRDLIKLYGIKS